MSEVTQKDLDILETNEWLEALESVVREEGVERAQFLLEQVINKASDEGVDISSGNVTNYINTIAKDKEPVYPGNEQIEHRIRSIIRWNAIMIVLRGSKKDLDLGGHMASYQSSAAFYEVCFKNGTPSRCMQTNFTLITWKECIKKFIFYEQFVETN